MATLAILLTATTLLAFEGIPRSRDPLYFEISSVNAKLHKGDSHEQILSSLNAAIEKNPASPQIAAAKELARDLADAVDASGKRARAARRIEDAPEEFLDSSKLPLYLLAYSENRGSLTGYGEKNPKDPAILLIKKGRASIERLIPALQNRTPIPVEDLVRFDDEPRVERVCDLAMELIEHLSLCKFHFNASTGDSFHELTPEVRHQTIARVAAWWKENKHRTVIEGVRSQLPHAESHEHREMLVNLIRQAERENSPKDKEFGLASLRKGLPSDNNAYTANALAKFGDFSAVDVFSHLIHRPLGGKMKPSRDFRC